LQAAGLDAPEGALTLAAPRTSSLMVGDDGTLSGKLAHVPWGRFAPYVLAVAEGQLAVLAVNTARVTLDRAVSRLPDDTLVFENVMAVAAAPCNEARAMQFGALMRAAQMAGAMETVLDMTVTYARERQQFGKPIGTFQAIQQQLAMMATQVAAASRAVDAAFDRIADGGEAGFEAAVAKIRCGDAAGQVASIAHQVHGAIGFTDEHRLHYFTRRLWSWRSDFGSASFWAEKLGAPIAALGPDQFWPTITAAG
jgi:alkylation response protein AidB-like acyl-CoA dehydrogenase